MDRDWSLNGLVIPIFKAYPLFLLLFLLQFLVFLAEMNQVSRKKKKAFLYLSNESWEVQTEKQVHWLTISHQIK